MNKPYETVSQIMAERDQLRAELAALKVVQGGAITEVSAETFSSDGTSEIITCNLPIGTKLYLSAPPASADAVSVPVELLKELIDAAEYGTGINNSELMQARALLAQSESKGVDP